MFGYIYPFKMDLKIRHYNTFKSYYCSLCHAIKKNYGNIPRISINFDTTFMAIFLDSLLQNNPIIEKKLCLIHPVEKKNIIKNSSSIDYASHITLILTHNKIIDDINDENNLLSKIIFPLSNIYIQKFPKYLEGIKNKILYHLNNLNKMEKSSEILSIDDYSHHFAKITKEVFSFFIKINNIYEDNIDDVERLGYNIGKWIYIMDAFNDIEKDFKQKSFNPILKINQITNENINIIDFKNSVKEHYRSLLTQINYQCLHYFNNLKIQKNYDLIENILQLGMPFKTDKIINTCNCSKKEVSNK